MMLALVNGQRSYAEPKQVGHCELCGGTTIPKCGRINVWHWAHKARDCDTWAESETQWHLDWQARFPADSCEIPIGNHRADVRSPTGLVIEFQHSALSADEIREREDHYGSMLWVFDAVEAFQTDRLNLRCKRPECNTRYGVSGYGRYLKDPRHPCCINEDDDTSICCERPEGECVTRRWHQPRNRGTVWRGSPGRGWHQQWLPSDGPDKSPCCDTLTDGEADPYRSFRWKHPRRSILHCRRPVFLDLGDGCLLELKKLYPNAPYGGWGYLCTVDAFLARCGLEFTFI